MGSVPEIKIDWIGLDMLANTETQRDRERARDRRRDRMKDREASTSRLRLLTSVTVTRRVAPHSDSIISPTPCTALLHSDEHRQTDRQTDRQSSCTQVFHDACHTKLQPYVQHAYVDLII